MLLDQREIDSLNEIVRSRVAESRERVRAVIYARGPKSAPPGMEVLDEPEKVSVFQQYLGRQAAREQRGVVPGNLHQTIAQHPAVAAMAVEDEEAPA